MRNLFINIFIFIFFITIIVFPTNANIETTIAILPFDNLTNDAQKKWIGYGFSETLCSGLFEFSTLRIVERTRISSIIDEIKLGQSGLIQEESIQEAGKLLGADYMVCGSYQMSENNLRVNCRIIETKTGEILSATKITNQFNSIFDIQDSLINVIVRNIKGINFDDRKFKVRDIETSNLRAYEYAIKGDISLDNGDFKNASILYEESLDFDAGYDRARDGINYSYFPMAVGNEWKFKSYTKNTYLEKPIESIIVNKITGTTVLNNTECIIEEGQTKTSTNNISVNVKVYLAYNEKGIYLHAIETHAGNILNQYNNYGGKQSWIFPLKRGVSFQSSMIGLDDKGMITVSEDDETITVPAGSFQCVKIEGRSGDNKNNYTYWLSRGIGMIKNESKYISEIGNRIDSTYTLIELLDYNLNKYTPNNKATRKKVININNIETDSTTNKIMLIEKNNAEESVLSLPIVKIVDQYFLVYQTDEKAIKVDDVFSIIRFKSQDSQSSDFSIIGSGKVVKIEGDKIALNFLLTEKKDSLLITDMILIRKD